MATAKKVMVASTILSDMGVAIRVMVRA
jgi:hypothetical protein